MATLTHEFLGVVMSVVESENKSLKIIDWPLL